MNIRSIQDSDKTAWSKLFSSYADFYQVELPASAGARVWEWLFDDEELFWCDVLESDGELVGFVQYQLMHRSLSGEKVCYLSDLFVNPELRGTGMGKALIDHVFAIAAERGWSNVRWLTQESNERARKLYDHYALRSEFVLYSVPVS